MDEEMTKVTRRAAQLLSANFSGSKIAETLRDEGFGIQAVWTWLLHQNFAAVIRGQVLLVSDQVLQQPMLAIAIAIPDKLPAVPWIVRSK